MRLFALTVPVLSTVLVGLASFGSKAPAGPTCLSLENSEETVTVLRAYAQAYHAEALEETQSHSYQTVGFLLDTKCTILAHVAGTRPTDSLDVEAAMALLFPSRSHGKLVIGGFADAVVPPDQEAGRPWLVWAVFAR